MKREDKAELDSELSYEDYESLIELAEIDDYIPIPSEVNPDFTKAAELLSKD